MPLSKQAKEGIRENNLSLEKQVDILADFIMQNFPQDIKDGGAIETAINIISRFEEEGEEKIKNVKGIFEAFTLMDWSGEAEVYAEIKRLERLVLSILNE